MSDEQSQSTTASSGSDGKAIAIISYITLIGWIIALIMHSNNKTEVGAFHLRQMLGLMLTSLVLTFIPILGWILNIGVFVLWILGLIAATQNSTKPVPLLGNFYQNVFSFIK